MSHTIYNDYWNRDKGNENLILNYPLNENSWIVELGGFEGWFTQKALDKFNCNILVVEPIYCEKLSKNFENTQNVIIECCGVSDVKKTIELYVDGDATSQYTKVSQNKIQVDCYPIEYFISKYNIEIIDLVQINVEGEEYPLLEKWITSDVLNKIKHIQVQYHDFVADYRNRKENIEKGLLERGFENSWDYDIVFSSWKNKKF